MTVWALIAALVDLKSAEGTKPKVVVYLQCHPHQAFVQRLKQRDITAFVGIGQVERDIRWRRPA